MTASSIPVTARDHLGLEVLSVDECLELLASEPVGRLAYLEAGEPLILPVSHVADGWLIAFRTAPGSKLSMASMDRPVAFEVDRFDPDTRTGWSVLVRGTAETVWSEAVEARLDALGLVPWLPVAERQRWVRIHPSEVSGRRLGAALAAEVER